VTSAAERGTVGDDSADSRLPFLDGVRGFAVAAVVLYHFGVAGVSGGLLGVDVFFVLSGFLITSLLCAEHGRHRTVRLGPFWARRARRLLPGLVILLLGVAGYAWAFRSTLDVSGIRGDALSSLLYVANWHFVFSAQGYFAQSASPSPLLHIWSLGVEEQYYVIWPLVALLVLRRRGPKALAWVAGAGAIASALEMASMYLAGVSIDRLYYGTDTRAQALLVGSALGALAAKREWRVVGARWASTRLGRVTGPVVGLSGAAVLAWCWHSFDGQEAFLYEGGFLLVAIGAGAVITAVTSWRSSVLARVCSFAPFVYLGRISYGVYLYHWPLELAIDHAHTGLSGAGLLGARLGATLAAATISFHLVEEPIRTGRLVRGWRGLTLVAGCGVTTAVVVLLSTSIPASATVSASLAAGSRGSTGLQAGERQQLAGTRAFTSDPVRFLLLGDSVALTAGVGLTAHSTPRFGVRVYDRATFGCDLDRTPGRLDGVVYTVTPGTNCYSWPALWARSVKRYRPDVVGLLIGRFELADHLWGSTWVHLGETAWDAHVESELDRAVGILSARGARVVLFTFPYVDSPNEQPNGSSYPENDPSRVDALNRLIRKAASAHPSTVTVFDLNRILDPSGHYAMTVDGVDVRWEDGIHVTDAGGAWLQSRVLPTIAQLGLGVRAAGGP